MGKDKNKKSGWGKSGNLATIFVLVLMMYACVALLPGLNKQVENITGNNTVAKASEQVAQYLSYNVGTPTWVLVVGVILIVGLGLAWYFGTKRKFSWLGDEETESQET